LGAGSTVSVLFSQESANPAIAPTPNLFDVSLSFSGSIAVYGVDVGGLSLNSYSLQLKILDATRNYSRENLDALLTDLLDAGVPQETAEDFVAVVDEAMASIESIEAKAFEIYDSIDSVDFSAMENLVSVDLTSAMATASETGTPVNIGAIINVIGSTHDDRLAGNAGSNVLEGGEGSDWINGRSGADQLFGGGGDDFIFFDFADGANVNGGSGRDVAVAVGDQGVTVNMATQGLECVIGCDKADMIYVTEDGQPVFAAGGGDSDHFILDNLEAHAPRILWGGDGADVFEFQNGGRVGLAVVRIDGLTEEAFSRLTLADLGLGDLDLSQISAIIINPDASDRFYLDDLELGTSSVNLGEWSTIGDDPDLLVHLVGGFSSPVSFGVRTTDSLGGQHAVQAVYDNEVRAHHVLTFNYNFFDVTVWSNGEYRVTETDTYVESPIQDVDEGIDDALMTAELVFAEYDQLGYHWATSEYWTLQEASTTPKGQFFVVGGQFVGDSLFANDDLRGNLPDAAGTSPFDWLLAA
jgi:hypothetical protein